ncbi:MAG: hypothetical protein WAU70_05370 [Flavobacteriales bacterium]
MDDLKDKNRNSTPKELVHIDPMDLHELLSTRPERLLGRIIELNRGARYHNSLDAISLMQRLLEVKGRTTPALVRKD